MGSTTSGKPHSDSSHPTGCSRDAPQPTPLPRPLPGGKPSLRPVGARRPVMFRPRSFSPPRRFAPRQERELALATSRGSPHLGSGQPPGHNATPWKKSLISPSRSRPDGPRYRSGGARDDCGSLARQVPGSRPTPSRLRRRSSGTTPPGTGGSACTPLRWSLAHTRRSRSASCFAECIRSGGARHRWQLAHPAGGRLARPEGPVCVPPSQVVRLPWCHGQGRGSRRETRGNQSGLLPQRRWVHPPTALPDARPAPEGAESATGFTACFHSRGAPLGGQVTRARSASPKAASRARPASDDTEQNADRVTLQPRRIYTSPPAQLCRGQAVRPAPAVGRVRASPFAPRIFSGPRTDEFRRSASALPPLLPWY